MGFQIGGIVGLLILVADIYAVVKTVQSSAATGAKVLWILIVLVLPVLGFVLWLAIGPKGVSPGDAAV